MDVKIMGPELEKTQTAHRIEQTGPILGLPEDEFAKLASSICVMIPHRPSEGISAGIIQAAGVWARHGVSFAAVDDQFRGNIDITRAAMAKTFLEYCRDRPSIDKVVLIDSDEIVGWDAPYRLAAWDLPIVSGVVCSISDGRGIWACFTVKDEYNVARFPSFNFTNKLPGKGLIEAHSVGGGLVCIKKKVFEDFLAAGETPYMLPQEMREQSVVDGVLKYGEDTWFCEQARKIGHKCYVDFSVRAVHIKSINVAWPMSHVDYNMDPREWRVSPKDYHHG